MLPDNAQDVCPSNAPVIGITALLNELLDLSVAAICGSSRGAVNILVSRTESISSGGSISYRRRNGYKSGH